MSESERKTDENKLEERENIGDNIQVKAIHVQIGVCTKYHYPKLYYYINIII